MSFLVYLISDRGIDCYCKECSLPNILKDTNLIGQIHFLFNELVSLMVLIMTRSIKLIYSILQQLILGFCSF